MARVAGFQAEEVEIRIDAVSLPFFRACDLAAVVDRESLLISVDAPEPPYWMHLWPGAVALARRVCGAAGIGRQTRVLEIGCGLGLPAVCAARRGARVVATDRKREPLAFARASAERNGASVAVLHMDWKQPAVRGPFDLCLGADVAYDAEDEEALVELFAGVLAPAGRVWLADSVNTARQTLPARLGEAGFAVSSKEIREEDEGRPVWVRLLEAHRR